MGGFGDGGGDLMLDYGEGEGDDDELGEGGLDHFGYDLEDP